MGTVFHYKSGEGMEIISKFNETCIRESSLMYTAMYRLVRNSNSTFNVGIARENGTKFEQNLTFSSTSYYKNKIIAIP